MSNDKKIDERNEFEKMVTKSSRKVEKKLTFDPITSELILKNYDAPQKQNEVIVDQIYKDGFF